MLPSSYVGHEDAFFLRSDDTDRTIQSGQALFTGMYPPATEGDTEVVGWNVMDSSTCAMSVCPLRYVAIGLRLATMCLSLQRMILSDSTRSCALP